MPSNTTQITPPRVPLTDERTGAVSREWYRWFYNLYTITGGGLGITPVINGGTGLSTIPTNGQLLIGNGTGYTLNTLGYGAGISVTNGAGTITVANTGVLSNIAGSGISVSNATGNVTVINTGVLSWSGGSTGLTPGTATTGAVTLGGTLAIASGGTNGSATPTAYGVAYGNGSAYAFTAAGTTGQVLTATTSGAPTWAAPATSGTVTSVGLSMPTQFTVTNSPVTSSGTLTASWNTQTANYVLSGPTTGAAAVPTFRALVAGDIPSLSYVSSVSATAPITSTGGLTPTIGVTSAALTKTDDTNVTVTLGGSPTTALLAATSLTLGWSGQLSVGRGGTGLSAGASGGIPYFSSTSAMTSSALLTQYGVVYGGGAGASPVATAAGTTGQILTATTGGAPTWSSTYAGTVTSVSFTGGLITVATSTTTPALTVAGTSGGIVYFSSASTWATSAALAANALVVGGGAGVAPSTVTTGTGVVTALGVNTGSAGAFVVNGGALGTPSSGTVTNLTGTASININGTVGATTANTGSFTSLAYTTTLTGGSGVIAIGTSQLYKDASGNFGINTASPATKLDTNGLGVIRGSSGRFGAWFDSINSGPFGTAIYSTFDLGSTQGAFRSYAQFSGSGAGVLNFDVATTGGSYGANPTGLTYSTLMTLNSVGNLGIGTSSPNASAIVDAQSTTKGVRFPNMTTTQKNAISSPAAGLVVFDTTLAKLCVYSGAAWQTITSI